MLWDFYLEFEVVPETVVLVGDGIVPKKLKGKTTAQLVERLGRLNRSILWGDLSD